ncbi:MAG: ChaN family lipoprotein [Halobacteriovoraceae bacterium]|jgi:uncharacterized iron-regulated protein|nr:ChaN family lipoprotein [Halobacteriovoraceae bacterium]MBT5093390.1 ChaN family lipoprotein [Halobacteriovoraceae bacterium]
MKKLGLSLILILLTPQVFALDLIYDAVNDRSLTEEAFYQQLPDSGLYVLGETHYTPIIQEYQGKLIRKIVTAKSRQREFTVGWEFLNYTDQVSIDTHVSLFNAGILSEGTLLRKLFPGSRKPEQNTPYLHSFRAAKELGGRIIGTNAPRQWKAIITKEGIGALDPEKIPANYVLGGDHYFERFDIAMGGHVGEDELPRYFEAQSYADAVMAYSFAKHSKTDLNFLLVGQFHSDYNDGVVVQARNLLGKVTSIKIVDAREMSVGSMRMIMFGHDLYGIFADYIYFVRN